jgi:ERCC4-type nuclease
VLLIDDRENQKVINKLLMRLGEENTQVLRMASSDYRIGSWGIEAKEINDLYRSILGLGRNGRTIVHQLRELQEDFDNPMLVVYGTKLKPYVHGGRPSAKQIAVEMGRMKKVNQQFKMTFYQRFPKIKYMELTTMDDFVEWLVINHTQTQVKEATGLNVMEKEIQTSAELSNLDPRVAALCSLKNISVQNAEDLLKEFGSIPKLLMSKNTQKSLMEVRGIGRYKAQTVLKLRDNY